MRFHSISCGQNQRTSGLGKGPEEEGRGECTTAPVVFWSFYPLRYPSSVHEFCNGDATSPPKQIPRGPSTRRHYRCAPHATSPRSEVHTPRCERQSRPGRRWTTMDRGRFRWTAVGFDGPRRAVMSCGRPQSDVTDFDGPRLAFVIRRPTHLGKTPMGLKTFVFRGAVDGAGFAPHGTGVHIRAEDGSEKIQADSLQCALNFFRIGFCGVRRWRARILLRQLSRRSR